MPHDFDLTDSLDILTRTPTVLDTLLRGSSADWTAANEGPETWSAFDVLGHLVHGEETDWVTRARIILEDGEDRPFDPFDRLAQFERFADWSVDAVLDRFATLRRKNLDTVREWQLTDEQLNLRGQHPELGPVTLRQLCATWTVHDLGHIGQITRVMAKRYRDEVGPWQAYLTVLHR